jgi:energy-coupling factor transporter ATP-binding protein EcfA2
MIAFQRAIKREAKLRLALSGPSGSGKTYTALTLAQALAGSGGKVAVLDTERGSASKYADLFEFDVLELESFHPDRYIEAIHDAGAAGYAVIVLDSLSHAWNGQGGLLEVHEQVVKRQATKNSYTAWAEVTPIQNRLIDAITSAPLHVIATMRSKTEYVQGEGKNGRTEIRKVGTAPIQRDGMEFEFDITGDLDQDNTLVVSKTRCPALTSAVIAKPGKALGDTLITWLHGAPAAVPAERPLHVVPDVQPMTPAQPAPKPAPKPAAKAALAPHWNALKVRAGYVGISYPTKWGELCKLLTGKDDASKYTLEDYDIVERDIQEREAEKQAQHELGIEYTDDPAAPIGTSTVDASGADLSTVGVGKHPAN